jgi:hypothetical protein
MGMAETDIISSSRRFGRLAIDAIQIRGDGGGVNPTLVFPLSIELGPLRDQQQIVVTEVRAELTLGAGTTLPGTRLGAGARARGAGGSNHIWASQKTHSIRHTTELRFALTPAQMHVLETVADTDQSAIHFALRFELEMAWLRAEHPMHQSPIDTPVYDLLPVAYLPAAEMTASVSRSQWADTILPALGGSGLRLVALRLPARGRLPDDVVSWYDEARLRLDRGDYRGAVERARDLRHSIEKHLQATRDEPVATKIALLQGIPAGSPAITFLDGLWRALADATNDAHHPDEPGPQFRAHEARAVVLTAATTLEYLQSVLDATR